MEQLKKAELFDMVGECFAKIDPNKSASALASTPFRWPFSKSRKA